jgi:hypothetical protein
MSGTAGTEDGGLPAADNVDVPPLEMSQSEYARHCGVRRQLVHKWIAAGKIPVLPNGTIDAVAADRARGQTVERVIIRDEPEPDAPRAAPEFSGLTKAKTATEVYRARLAQLEYEERSGRLVPIDDVHRAASDCAEALVRVSALPLLRAEALLFAASKGLPELRAALKGMIREQRQRGANELAKLPAAIAAGRRDADMDAS